MKLSFSFFIAGLMLGVIAIALIYQRSVTVGDLMPIPLLIMSGILIAWSDEE